MISLCDSATFSTEDNNQNRYLAAIVHSSNDAIVGQNLAGLITTWNRAAEKTFGYSADEVVGKHVSVLAPVAGSDEITEILRRIANGEMLLPYETVRKRKDGSEIYVSATMSPIKDDAGKIIGACKIARDVSERRSADEDRFRLVVEAAPNAMMIIGRDGRITLLNRHAEKLFGYTRQELIGQMIEVLMPARFRESHISHRLGFLESPSLRAMGKGRDLCGVRKDGSEVPIEIGLNLFDTSDGSLVLASIMDISERKMFESSLKQSLAEKQVLLQEIHHRVKNNLQIISSLLSLQAGLIKDRAAVATLQDSQRRVISMALIHEQLYSNEDMSSVDLADYVSQLTTHLFSSFANTKRIACRLDLVPTKLSIDQAVPCGLILNELVTNAIKYAYPERTGEVVVRLRSEMDKISLTVSDAGVGMPADFAYATSKSLGMKIIHLLTAQLDGAFSMSPRPGASFTVCFNKVPISLAPAALGSPLSC